MTRIAKNISVVAIVLGMMILIAGAIIMFLIRKPGTVILEFTSVCPSDSKNCNVTVVQNDVTKKSKDVCLFVWGVEQMGTDYKIHNDVNPLCKEPVAAGQPRISQLDPSLNSEGYTCQTIQVDRKKWYLQILKRH